MVYRLFTASFNGQATENYRVDGAGNRTSSQLGASYTYQPFNKLTSTSTATYSYDNNGNLLTKTDSSGTWQYVWDGENCLTQVTRPDGVSVSYRCDQPYSAVYSPLA